MALFVPPLIPLVSYLLIFAAWCCNLGAHFAHAIGVTGFDTLPKNGKLNEDPDESDIELYDPKSD